MDCRVYFGKKLVLTITDPNPRAEVIENAIFEQTGLSPAEYYLLNNGRRLKGSEIIPFDVQCVLRTLGGKGGFGSMLRAIGAQIEKTTNREACRDLSGRRLRDINEEKRLKAWLEKQKDRENEAEEKRKKKLEKLVAVPKHEFKDSEYENARTELTEKVSEAVEEGFKKAVWKPLDPIAVKRKAVERNNGGSKRAALWIADDVSSSSDDDSNSDTDLEGESPSCKIKDKLNSEKENSIGASCSSDAESSLSQTGKESSGSEKVGCEGPCSSKTLQSEQLCEKEVSGNVSNSYLNPESTHTACSVEVSVSNEFEENDKGQQLSPANANTK